MAKDSLQSVLQEIRNDILTSTEATERQKVWQKMHLLAENQMPEAKELFITLLEHPDWSWRLEALQDLGFHYPLQPESEAVKKVRQLVLNDPNDFVRMTAASVLGIRSVWPEPFLLTVLDVESDKEVLEAAFEASLKLTDFPHLEISKVMRKVKAGEIHPTVEQLQTLLESTKWTS